MHRVSPKILSNYCFGISQYSKWQLSTINTSRSGVKDVLYSLQVGNWLVVYINAAYPILQQVSGTFGLTRPVATSRAAAGSRRRSLPNHSETQQVQVRVSPNVWSTRCTCDQVPCLRAQISQGIWDRCDPLPKQNKYQRPIQRPTWILTSYPCINHQSIDASVYRTGRFLLSISTCGLDVVPLNVTNGVVPASLTFGAEGSLCGVSSSPSCLLLASPCLALGRSSSLSLYMGNGEMVVRGSLVVTRECSEVR